MPRYLIIDGYNAINKTGLFESKKDISLESARTSFIKGLNNFMSKKRTFDKVFVVFDSKEECHGIRRHSNGAIETLFTNSGKDADSVIVDILRNASSSDEISVSSDDNFVRNHAKVFGCPVISIAELQRIVWEKKGDGCKMGEKGLKIDKVNEINKELKKYWGVG